MDNATLQKLIAMIIYMVGIIGIGVYFAKKAAKNSENFFIGGRSLGPWVAAFSAEASDMSGYLLMGLPGLAYWTGLAEAGWTCIGLALGTYLNFLIVSKRLRRYSIAVDAFTLPDFFSSRFAEKKKVIMFLASCIIVLFFSIYAAQCLSACAKLFANIFGASYKSALVVSAVFVLAYTFLGGFLAESVADFVQAIIMVSVLILVMVVLTVNAGGISSMISRARSIPGFFSLTSISSPVNGAAGSFGQAKPFGFLDIVSTMAWGLGYFGVPQVLIRFMAIRTESELKLSRRVAVSWVVVSMLAAIFIGIAGRSIVSIGYASNAASENIFIDAAALYLPAFLAGIAAAGIIAASMSSSDSYLLISASAISQSMFKGIFKKDATDKQVMICSRATLCVVTIAATIIGWNSNSTIFAITSFAWAGLGAGFGPLMLFSLFYKGTTRAGAISGMLAGSAMVFVWKLAIKPLGGAFAIYELLPSFAFASLVIYVVSKFTTDENEKELSQTFDSVVCQ